MIFLLIVACLVIFYCLIGIKNSISIMAQKHGYKLTVKDFLNAAVLFQEILDKDYDAQMIMKFINTETNVIKLGVIKPMVYTDSKELRYCMLKCGEFIIQYAEYLRKYYGYRVDPVTFNDSIKVLRHIRRIAMQKGEKTIVEINIEK